MSFSATSLMPGLVVVNAITMATIVPKVDVFVMVPFNKLL